MTPDDTTTAPAKAPVKAPAYDFPPGASPPPPPPPDTEAAKLPKVTRTNLPDGTILEREVLTTGTVIERRLNSDAPKARR